MQSSGQMSWQPPQRMHSVPSAGLSSKIVFVQQWRQRVPSSRASPLPEALLDLGDADAPRDRRVGGFCRGIPSKSRSLS